MVDQPIAVLGGGNGGHAMAADLTLRGFKVKFYEMPEFEENVKKVLATKRIRVTGITQAEAKLFDATTDIHQAIDGCALVFITVPAFAHKDYARLLAPLLKKKHTIVLWPGTFGSLEFKKILFDNGNEQEIVIAECDTLPYVTRLEGEGCVHIGEYESLSRLGVFPSSQTKTFARKMAKIYKMEFYNNVLECGLSSCNPVLHVGAFVLNIGRVEYQARRAFYFYEEGYTKSTAKVCEKVDEERLEIARRFGFELKTITQMLSHSGNNLMESVKASYSLTHICGPNTTDTRYLKEDAPYGLVPWIALGKKVGAPTVMMESLVNIINTIFDVNYYEQGRTLESMGLQNLTPQGMIDFVMSGRKP